MVETVFIPGIEPQPIVLNRVNGPLVKPEVIAQTSRRDSSIRKEEGNFERTLPELQEMWRNWWRLRPIKMTPKAIAIKEEKRLVGDSPTIGSHHTRERDNLEVHLDKIQQKYILSPEASVNEKLHEVSIAQAQKRRVRKIFMYRNGLRLNKLPLMFVPAIRGISRVD